MCRERAQSLRHSERLGCCLSSRRAFCISRVLCQQSEDLSLHGAGNARFAIANVNIYFAAHAEFRHINSWLHGVAGARNQVAAVVCLEAVHIYAIALNRLADTMTSTMDKIFSVTGFFYDGARGFVHLPSLQRLARSD